jgi:hypothetical protein
MNRGKCFALLVLVPLLLSTAAAPADAALTASPPLQITAAVPSRPITSAQEVFLDATYDFTTVSGKVTLAGTSDGSGQFYVDDEVRLTVSHEDGSIWTYTRNFEFQPAADPVDVTSYFEPGVNRVHAVLRDTYGGNLSATELWLVNQSTASRGPNYVALGDSFASGEGANEKFFQLGTSFDDPKNPGGTTGWHRSSTAWSGLVADQALKSGLVGAVDYVACSGAVADNLYGTNRTYARVNEIEVPQLSYVNNDTVLATLSMGGNDVGFADILVNCVGFFQSSPNGYGCRKPGTQASHLVDTQLGRLLGGGIPTPSREAGHSVSLSDIYLDIAHKMSPRGTLIVTGYPKLFAESKNLYLLPTVDGAACRVGSRQPLNLGVSFKDAQWLNGIAAQANDAIEKSVGIANKELTGDAPHPTVVFAPTSGKFSSHRLCSLSSWINGVELTTSRSLPDRKQQSFHPKKDGQTAYYQAVCGAIPANGKPKLTCKSTQ